jgi:plastocyanin
MRCALAFILFSTTVAAAQPPAWVTVKGQVVLPKDSPLPVPPNLVVVGAPQCLAKGALKDEKVLVDAKSRGIKNVVVWLRPNNANAAVKFQPGDIHPADAKRKAEDVIIDQPCCLFTPRVLAARVGDTIVVKNPAAINHNFFWTSANNGELNINIPPNGQHRFANPLVAESSPIQYKCTVHPWMTGYVRIFDHPYFAVTDADGKFEIKNAPAGNWRIVYWHESVGFKGGKEGRTGDPISIPGNTLEMRPIDFAVK